MTRRIISILLIVASLFSVMGKLAVFTYYQVNKQYIATYLCKKKDEPDSCCKGKCFLKDTIKKVDTPDIDTELPFPANTVDKEFILYHSAVMQISFNAAILPFGYLPYGVNRHDQKCSISVFHPPELQA
ncbi:MAG: hypothetical protein LC101_11875 [Flavobacteriales bacterium]|nr:hypothetical protein [Flavobacteriales bacterium]